jgi:hypothetical protein
VCFLSVATLWRHLGHPAKNDCSTEVLLDFCTRVTFLRSVPGNSAREDYYYAARVIDIHSRRCTTVHPNATPVSSSLNHHPRGTCTASTALSCGVGAWAPTVLSLGTIRKLGDLRQQNFYFPERQCWVQEMAAQVPHTAGITTFTILLTSQRVSIAPRMHTHIKPCLVSMATSPSSYTSWQ